MVTNLLLRLQMSLVVVMIIEQRVLHYFKCISISTGSQISDHYHMYQKDKQMVFRSFIFLCVLQDSSILEVIQSHVFYINLCRNIYIYWTFALLLLALFSPSPLSYIPSVQAWKWSVDQFSIEIPSEHFLLIFWSARNLLA